jgi:hypothetical protein
VTTNEKVTDVNLKNSSFRINKIDEISWTFRSSFVHSQWMNRIEKLQLLELKTTSENHANRMIQSMENEE